MNKSIVVLGVVLLVLLSACESDEVIVKDVVRPVKTMLIRQPEQTFAASFPGKLEAAYEVNLAFEVPGRLDRLPVKVGDRVKRGELIAELSKEAYRARLESARAQYKQAKSELQRMARLLKNGSVSETQYDAAQTAFDVSASQLALREKEYQDCTLKAPFDGMVVAIYQDNYSFVGASTQVARIINMNELEMWIDVPEMFFKLEGKVSGYQAFIYLDAFPGQRFEVKIKEISREASSRTRSFPISVVLHTDNDSGMLPGMSGRVEVIVDREMLGISRQIEIPASAIFTPEDQSQTSVWLVKDGRVVLQPVELAEIQKHSALITSGLVTGDVVVTAGVNSLTEQQEVKLLSPSL